LITYRPSDAEIGMNQYNLKWLIDNQVLTLEGDLGLYRYSNYEANIPLEVWAQIADETQETGNLTSNSNSKETQDELEDKRNLWLKNNPWVWGYPLAKHPYAGELFEYTKEDGTVINVYERDQDGNETGVLKTNPDYKWSNDSKNTLPFKLTVNTRLQVGIIISLDSRRGYSGLLEAEYAGGDYTQWYWDHFDEFGGGSAFSANTLNLSLVEGDSIEWDGSNFTVQHYGQIIFKDNYCTSLNHIIPIFATSLGQTEEQALEQGRLDDPLTDEDEGLDLSGDDDPTTFRPVDFNKRRLEAIRRSRYRNGSQTIGSAFLAGLAYMALTFIRRG